MKVPVKKYMTREVHTVGCTIPIVTALGQMHIHHVRHLPVLKAGRLVGIISERDVKFLVTFNGARDLVVADVMITEPYAVSPDSDLAEVAAYMAKHQLGSTIIEEPPGKVVGIFTFEDGLRALVDALDESQREAGDKAA